MVATEQLLSRSSWHYDADPQDHPMFSEERFERRRQAAGREIQALVSLAQSTSTLDIPSHLRSSHVFHPFCGYGGSTRAILDLGILPENLWVLDQSENAVWDLHAKGIGTFSDKNAPKLPYDHIFVPTAVEDFIQKSNSSHQFSSIVGLDCPPEGIGQLIQTILERDPRFCQNPFLLACTTLHKDVAEESPLFEPKIVESFFNMISVLRAGLKYKRKELKGLAPDGWTRYGYVLVRENSRG